MTDYPLLLKRCSDLLSDANIDTYQILTKICVFLQKEVKYYNWVGFYMADHQKKTLHLKAFAGIPTDHTEIPFGKGICGQVAISNQNFIVEDVSSQKNYIACDIHVKSEIVIPLFLNGINIGQIDIDSNTINAFSEKDTKFLEQLNSLIAKTLF